MTNAPIFVWPRSRRLWVLLAGLGLAALALAGCGSGPPPAIYVLGSEAGGADSVEPLAGRPVVEVKPVLLPDYLDVTDMLVRRAPNLVVPSRTGRWGERLSLGMTNALATALTHRLPGSVVTATPPVERPARQILVDVDTFEPRATGSVVLVARWRVVTGDRRDTLAGEHVSLVEPLAHLRDADIAAAMTRAVDDLADRIADGVHRSESASLAGPDVRARATGPDDALLTAAARTPA